ncbi:MAG: tyrosine-type recombinase/integrase [Clostridia bacterium]
MELSVIKTENDSVVVLLDNDMKIVKPVQNYLKHQARLGRSFNTILANGRDLKQYWGFLNHRGYDYTKITPIIIAEFIEFLRSPDGMNEKILTLHGESKRSGKTVNRILSTVYCFYKYCCLVLEIENPIMMESINRPQNMFKSILHHTRRNNHTHKSIFKIKESEANITIVPDAHIELVLDNLSTERDRLIFKTLYLTGARIGEVLDLKIENIPFPNSDKPFGVLKNIKSKGKNRDLFIPTSLIEEIDNFIINERSEIDTKHSYLFVSLQKQNFGKPLTYRGIYEVFCRAKKKLGISFNFHDIRHTFITHLAETGMDISIISKIAGHKQISTTEKYTHLSDQHVGESLARYWQNSILIGGEQNVE